jgi:hypothetical protein
LGKIQTSSFNRTGRLETLEYIMYYLYRWNWWPPWNVDEKQWNRRSSCTKFDTQKTDRSLCYRRNCKKYQLHLLSLMKQFSLNMSNNCNFYTWCKLKIFRGFDYLWELSFVKNINLSALEQQKREMAWFCSSNSNDIIWRAGNK